VIIDPIVFREIRIDDQAFLTALGPLVHRNPSFSSCVRKISIALPAGEVMEDHQSNNLVLLLLRVPQLRAFQMDVRPVQAAYLECLTVSATHLTELYVAVRHHLFLVFSIIRKMPSLRTLGIKYGKSGHWNMASARPFISPHLTHFSWEWTPANKSGEVALFLSKCIFARECTFQLVIPKLAGADAAPLKSWLLTHQPTKIGICMTEEAIFALSQPLSRVAHVEFISILPSIHLFEEYCWPSFVSILPGQAQIDAVPAFLDGLISLLSDVSTRGHITPSLKCIKLVGINHGASFSWSPPNHAGGDPFSGLRRTLTRCAVELNRYHIKLVDSESRDLKSYFE
jgi:hypothetical protein